MEFCNGLNLKLYIENHKKRKQPIYKEVIFDFLLNICSGLEEIHNKNIIHRDLNPKNLFLTNDLIVKIGDFGLAKQLIGINDFTNSYTGTPDYMAPEQKNQELYNNKVDIWALGCILYELCTLNPYSLKKDKSINIQFYGYEIQDLINVLLNKDYNKRPNIKNVLSILNDYIMIYNLNIERREKKLRENENKKNFISRFINLFSSNNFLCPDLNNDNNSYEHIKSLTISVSSDKQKENNENNIEINYNFENKTPKKSQKPLEKKEKNRNLQKEKEILIHNGNINYNINKNINKKIIKNIPIALYTKIEHHNRFINDNQPFLIII